MADIQKIVFGRNLAGEGVSVEAWISKDGMNQIRHNYPAEGATQALVFAAQLAEFFDAELHVDPQISFPGYLFLPSLPDST